MNDDSGLQTLESMSLADWYNGWAVSKFQKHLKGRIIEIGCSIGNFTHTLNNFGKVYAIDINKKYIYKKNVFLKKFK